MNAERKLLTFKILWESAIFVSVLWPAERDMDVHYVKLENRYEKASLALSGLHCITHEGGGQVPRLTAVKIVIRPQLAA